MLQELKKNKFVKYPLENDRYFLFIKRGIVYTNKKKQMICYHEKIITMIIAANILDLFWDEY